MNKKIFNLIARAPSILQMAFLFIASITVFHSANAELPETGNAKLRPLVNLARANPKESGEGIILTQRFLSSFIEILDSSIPAADKVAQLSAKLHNLDLFLAANTRTIPKWLFEDLDREIKSTRLDLSRYEMYAKNPSLPHAKEYSRHWAGEVRKRAVWANRIAKALQPIVAILRARDTR